MATQNLPKNAIEKIQVYRETDYSKDNIDDNPADSMLTMNIRLREDKKFGYFGKAGAGIGTDDRYEFDGSGLAYNKKMRGGIAASLNNINKSASLREMFQQSTYRNYNPNNRYVANFGSNGINRILFLGGEFQYDFSQANNSRFNNQLRANYDFRSTQNLTTSSTDSRIIAPNNVYLQDAEQQSTSENNTHSAGLSYNKRDQDKDFSVNLNLSSANSERNSTGLTERFKESDGSLVSSSNNANNSVNSSNGLNFSTSFRNKDDDDRNLKSFGVNYNMSFNSSEGESKNITDFISNEPSTASRYYNRKNNNDASSFNTSLGMNYNALKRLLFGNFSLWNINMVLNNNVSFSNSASNTLVSDFDSLTAKYIINDSLTNNNRVTRIEDRPSLRLSKNFSRRLSDRFNRYINVAANVQGQFLTERNESNFDYRNIDRSFNFFTPSASVGYNYQRFNKYTVEANLNGSSNPSIPSIDQLRPIIDTSTNVYNINLGNPNLKPSVTNGLNFSFNYRREQPSRKADLSFELNGGASQVNRGIIDSSFVDSSSVRTVYLINMDGRRNYNSGFIGRASFKLKNNKVLQFNYSLNYSNTTSPNFVNGLPNVATANNLTHNFGVFYTLGDIGNIQASQAINSNSSRQSSRSLQSQNTINYITQGNLNLSPIKDLTFSTTINYVTNNTTSQSSTLWNAFATYRFLKTKQAEVKLSAMDILKKNQNITTTSSLNNVSTTVSNSLQQFFMVTLSYYPRKFGGGGRRGGGGRGEGGEGGGGERRNFERRGSGGGGFGGGGGGGMRGRN
ncbi:outer membrane beta-barrel protein [Niabella hibiscisoli]|uniref:outer membrane beta-barrel protein n=1 Tax=Niabella hibiscisoli TaxID=1825928 RepID=UPI001F0CFF82|nr:outer membrane beta-barrel protein [Niabella hibiscisoli]MCH5715395.1 outer membrane beta-barrel family protein [Niabella hibiscisoli]